jgi:hypothetical protein
MKRYSRTCGQICELEIVAMFKFERKSGINRQIGSLRMAIDLGMDKNDFQ